MSTELRGLRTIIYPTTNLASTKAWWHDYVGFAPYFDEPFYVGFDVAGYELGLLPDADPDDGALVYWGVHDVVAAVDAALEAGATVHVPASEVGDDIVTATVRSPGGEILGFIYNPHFRPESAD